MSYYIVTPYNNEHYDEISCEFKIPYWTKYYNLQLYHHIIIL